MSGYPTIRPSESHTYLNSLIRAAVMDAVKSNAELHLILRRLLGMIDDQNFHRSLLHLQFQSKLLL